jgi:hypothetical protein
LHLSARGADAEQSEQWAWLQPWPYVHPLLGLSRGPKNPNSFKKQKGTLMANGNPAWKATTCEMLWLIYISQSCHLISQWFIDWPGSFSGTTLT